MKKPLKKKLHIPELTMPCSVPNRVWSYNIGTSGVQIRTPDLKKTEYVRFGRLLNDELDGDEKIQVKPSDVKEYIRATDGLTHPPIWLSRPAFLKRPPTMRFSVEILHDSPEV